MTNRRDLLLIGLGLAGVAAGWQAWVGRPTPFVFEPMSHLPGWRTVQSGQMTQTSAATLLTIGQDSESVEPMSESLLMDTLYQTGDSPGIAVFSDFFCPFCRVLTSRLANRPDLSVTWHELPLLGANSVLAARAALAAELQGHYAQFVKALAENGFRPTPAHMGRVANGIGIDGPRLIRDMSSSHVAMRLDLSRRAAATLGVFGTPGLTVGRTLVMGEIEMDALDRLIALES